MPSVERLRNRLLKKLSELFQLDQPDLDFGFYRIMHAKAQEVQDFISVDLLKIVADTFGDIDEARKVELQAIYEEAIQTAMSYGASNPEETDPVKEAKAALDAVKDTASSEADIYDHLYRFFERYYDNGDFISRRYYTRETSGKAAPFAVPYNGEEVKLHWANADQYYIKSAEYFSNFTFDLRQAKEIRAARQENQIGMLLGVENESPLKVNFRVVEATEGEHGNVKVSDANKRFFILHADNPVAQTETGELVVNFEYRPDPKKTGQENTWRNNRNAQAVETILERLQNMAWGGHEKQVVEYLRLFKVLAPTESDKKRTLLAKYVNQYTARNTMDYFIHKNLSGFLRRELDFYIKNEVMRLDDIENAEAPAVESYLAKIKVLRKIASKLIDFLVQLEDFQKKLWLKKKFIVETNYCITLDRVPEELYAEVAANKKQCEEWIKLFAIDEIQADVHNPGFSQPATAEFFRANNKLVLDTRFFDESFKARLVAAIENFDEQCNGLLIHSENFQALNLLRERYREQVKLVYIDPPYNTAASEILYKNEYRHSSWLSLMAGSIMSGKHLMNPESSIHVAIDDAEGFGLKLLLDEIFGSDNYVSTIAIQHNPRGRADAKHISPSHEYLHIYANNYQRLTTNQLIQSSEELEQKYRKRDGLSAYRELPFKRSGSNSRRNERPNLYYPIYYSESKRKLSLTKEDDSFFEILPIDSKGEARVWRWQKEKAQRLFDSEFVVKDIDGRVVVYVKDRIKDTIKPKSFWHDSRYDASSHGTMLLKKLFVSPDFDYPKSVHSVTDSIKIGSSEKDVIIDYFGGSGTTAESVIRLNQIDSDSHRKFILIEMGNHFDSTLLPRTKKVIYSSDWNDGKPIARDTGISHCFKYLRLESYEDTLNNLRFDHNLQVSKALAANWALKEDYMLHYLLDVETRGSQSILNIDAFADPTVYSLKVKKPGTDEYATRAVDLIETFNYLIGLRVLQTSAPQTYQAIFKRIPDPELSEDQYTKLVVDGIIWQDASGSWWFRKVEGWVPKDPANPNNGQRENVLIIWRKFIGDIEQDNLMLDEWFQKNRTSEFEFDTIYVNGSNNLSNLKMDDENWKVRLVEEEFMKRMWNDEYA